MSQEQFYILAAKVLSKEASSGEIADFKYLIEGNQEWKAAFLNLEELWNSQPAYSLNISDTEEAYLLHLGRLKTKVKDFEEDSELVPQANEDFQLYPVQKSWFKKNKFYAIALALIVISIFSLRSFNHSYTVSDKVNEINVNPGAKTKLQLPDGSQVWVNSDSKLSYSENFKDTVREVFLEGEAYFDVAKDSAHPFIVHTSGIDIKVLGTAFNVKAYRAEPTIEATLIHGTIEVTKPNQSNPSKVILKPHEKLTFDKLAAEQSTVNNQSLKNNTLRRHTTIRPVITITPIAKSITDSAIIETSWIYNRLSFEEEEFENLAVKMQRWFNVKITIINDKVKSYRLTGSFENETIEEALRELKYLVSFNYQINGREVIINRR